MVRARPARARADEARPPAPPVPREVHPAARRDPARAVRAGRAGACSTRSRAPGRRSSSRSRAVSERPASTSRPSTACSIARQDGAVQRVRPGERDPGRLVPSGHVQVPGTGPWLHRPMVRAAGGRRAARLPLADRRLRARRRPPRRARPRGAVGAADDALRPRLPAGAAGRARTGATSTSGSAAPSSAPSTSSAATRSTRSRGSRRSRASATGSAEASRPARRRARARARRAASTR